MTKQIKLKIHHIRIPVYRGVDLVKAREEAGLSQQQMAERCDWSKGKQGQMETPMEHRIDEGTLRIINEALNQANNTSKGNSD